MPHRLRIGVENFCHNLSHRHYAIGQFWQMILWCLGALLADESDTSLVGTKADFTTTKFMVGFRFNQMHDIFAKML